MVSNKEIKDRLHKRREGKSDDESKSPREPKSGLICPNCSENNPPYALFCFECGKSLSETDEDKSPENIESNGYVVCDLCYGVHKLTELESPEDYKICQCGGNYTYVREVGDIETPTKICVLCDAENPYSAERCSQCGKIFKDYIEYLQTKPYDIEITDNNIRVYHKRNKTILKVNKYDRTKIVNFRLSDSFMRKNLEFNYGGHNISLSISPNQAKYVEKFIAYSPLVVCANINCEYDALLKEGENCPVCGELSKKISSYSYEQLKESKHREKERKKTEEKINRQKKAAERQAKMQEEYEEKFKRSEGSGGKMDEKIFQYQKDAKTADLIYKAYVTDGFSRLEKVNGRFLASQTIKLDTIIEQNQEIIKLLKKIAEK